MERVDGGLSVVEEEEVIEVGFVEEGKEINNSCDCISVEENKGCCVKEGKQELEFSLVPPVSKSSYVQLQEFINNGSTAVLVTADFEKVYLPTHFLPPNTCVGSSFILNLSFDSSLHQKIAVNLVAALLD
eukprot:m.59806 g.59806  ORF g.59806 m.59806 type:complete len:130 (-) comp7923_c0_seq1:1889-2278(-)